MNKKATFVVDRGFRDCVDVIENTYELNVRMPSCMQKDQAQLTTEEANLSRIVTKIRWVVEVINGLLKRSFKALSFMRNRMLSHTEDDYRIAAALINRFYRRLFSDKGNQLELAQRMLKRLNTPNNLNTVIDVFDLHKKSEFVEIDSISKDESDDFPELTFDYIRYYITFGSYQLRIAISYLAEHFDVDGINNFLFKVKLVLLLKSIFT
jgi:hypothetical protein